MISSGACETARRRAARLAWILFAAAATPAAAIVGGGDSAGGGPVVMVANARGGLCSGVLIAADVVLTAAHCLAGTIARVRGEGGVAAVTASALHPQFRRDAIRARRLSIDLAVARLDRPLGAAAALSAATEPPQPGAAIDAAGYGVAREPSGGVGAYRRAALVVKAPHGVGRVTVWAGDPAPGGGLGGCQGDSGGPMREAGGAVVAIIAWSTGRGARKCGEYTQGILVSPQRDWIDRSIAPWGAQAEWR